MILIDDVLELHWKSIEDFGGSHGLRDMSLLESAIARPFQTFDGEDLYTNIFQKAAALGESLIVNHPFVDGNKRTGMLCMTGFLIVNGYSLTALPDDLYTFIIDISTGTIAFEVIAEWLKNNTQTK